MEGEGETQEGGDVGMHACVLSHFSCAQLFATLWTVAHQAALSGILQARILEWVAIPPPGYLPDPGIEPAFLRSPALANKFFSTSANWEALECMYTYIKNLFTLS